MVDERAESGVTRRTLIKRVGAGTAMIWAAPVVTNMASPAFAQSGYGICPECAIADDNCGGQPSCGQGPDGNPCSCLKTQAGGCFCHACTFCGSIPVCGSNADCPPNWACSLSCCSANDTDFRCHPPCGASPDPCAGAAPGAVGATSMG